MKTDAQLTVSLEDQRRICDFALLAQQIEEKSQKISQIRNKIESGRDALKGLEMVLDEDEPIFTRCGMGFLGIPYNEAVAKTRLEIETDEKLLQQLNEELKVENDRSAILKRVLQSKFGDAIRLEY